MTIQTKTWCISDEHHLFEYFVDFNLYLESEDGEDIRERNGITGLSQPSKALYAGDKEAYDQAFKEYCTNRRNEVLNKTYLSEQFSGDHWFDRNQSRFDQLLSCLESKTVVPFIGAGLSVEGTFPTWKDHLRQQGRTAGMDEDLIDSMLDNGEYEKVIEEIENKRGRDVFIQEIRDVFSRTGNITGTTLRLTELFSDTLITTNYDRLIEQGYDTGKEDSFQIINPLNAMETPDVDKTTLIKLHGDIQNPARCILSRKQYDQAYGNPIDLGLALPKLLSYYYRNGSLLFLGCSLNNDRTVQVFQAIKDEMGDTDRPQHFAIEQTPEDEAALIERNSQLLKLGITAIWFEKGRFDYVENILALARSELRYRGVLP